MRASVKDKELITGQPGADGKQVSSTSTLRSQFLGLQTEEKRSIISTYGICK